MNGKELLEYVYEQDKIVSLVVSDGKRDDLSPEEIRRIMFNRIYKEKQQMK